MYLWLEEMGLINPPKENNPTAEQSKQGLSNSTCNAITMPIVA